MGHRSITCRGVQAGIRRRDGNKVKVEQGSPARRLSAIRGRFVAGTVMGSQLGGETIHRQA